MEAGNEIASRIDKIKEIFLHITAIIPALDFNLLTDRLEDTHNEFRSVAYEAAAMSLALKDISNGTSLSLWREFMEGPGAKHTAQIHVGLGWAISQQRVAVLPVIETLDPIMAFRVLDGYGYYDGTFRQRKAIAARIIPPEMESKFLQGYDQGVGRSLWYIFKGDVEKIPAIIGEFPLTRHEDLWRGVGIACVYVGGFDENMLRELLTRSAECRGQLAVSAAMVSSTRRKANALTPGTELACRIWCNCTADDASAAAENAEKLIGRDREDAYEAWLANIAEKMMAR